MRAAVSEPGGGRAHSCNEYLREERATGASLLNDYVADQLGLSVVMKRDGPS